MILDDEPSDGAVGGGSGGDGASGNAKAIHDSPALRRSTTALSGTAGLKLGAQFTAQRSETAVAGALEPAPADDTFAYGSFECSEPTK